MKRRSMDPKLLKPKKPARPAGRLLSHRVQFVSLQQEADDAAPHIAKSLNISDVSAISAMLQHFGSTLLFRASFAFETATKKAIEEASNLIQDPDYHQTVKERRRRDRARQQLADEEREAKRRNPPKPTLEEVQHELTWTRQNAARYAEWAESCNAKVAELEKLEAELIAASDSEEPFM